jgi:hypothetical protein
MLIEFYFLHNDVRLLYRCTLIVLERKQPPTAPSPDCFISAREDASVLKEENNASNKNVSHRNSRL